MTPPTADQIEQAAVVESEIAHTLNNLARDGFPAAILAAGLAICCADLITCTVGVEEVPKWFAEQALAAQAMLDKAA